MPELQPDAYHIPQYDEEPEIIPSQPDMHEASPVDSVAQYVALHYDSLVRGTSHYENRPALIAEEAERQNKLRGTIDYGNGIFARRQAEIQNRIAAMSKTGAMERVVRLIMNGQIESSVDKAKLAEDTFRTLVNQESNVGSALMEKLPNVDHVFFLSPDDPRKWLYHARLLTRPDTITLSYAVSASESMVVTKSIAGGPYMPIDVAELERFTALTEIYTTQVNKELYGKDSYELAA